MDFSVLIVDDEEEMCLSLSELFSSKGIKAEFTTKPLEVPEFIRASPPDLIVMDIKMPGIGGIDLLRAIKEFNASVPVMMITGYPSVESAVLLSVDRKRIGTMK